MKESEPEPGRAVLCAHERPPMLVCVCAAMLKRCDEIFSSSGWSVGTVAHLAVRIISIVMTLKTLLWTPLFLSASSTSSFEILLIFTWMRRKTFNVLLTAPPPATYYCTSAEICCTRFLPADLILITTSLSLSLSQLANIRSRICFVLNTIKSKRTAISFVPHSDK